MRIIHLGRQDYLTTWEQMKLFSSTRDENTEDELWVVEHQSVFTEGISSKPEHLLSNSNIAVIKTDRGGQITYHAPGQLIVYCLIDIKRLGIGVRKMVNLIERSIIKLLSNYNIKAQTKKAAPGVYVDGAKIAALGLKVKHGRTYHGLSLNVDMSLRPFAQINPCGYPALKVTQMCDLTDNITIQNIADELTQILTNNVARN